MSRNLTKKQRGFIKDYLRTGNGTQSALANYDTDDKNTAHVIASENLLKPTIQLALKDRIDDELLEKVHLEGLSASFPGQDGEEFPDYSVRHKYLDTAYKVKGLYAPDKLLTVNVDTTLPNEKLLELSRLLNNP